ncbi:MAG: 50S ribosomal protein L25 [Phycisphaerales bacterium]
MSSETPVISCEVRERTGTRFAQRLRKAGRLPATVYGHKEAPVSISVDSKSMLAHLHHGNRVFELKSPRGSETVLVKDLQFGYLGDNVVHLDFARVNLNEEVNVNVTLKFIGEPASANQAGAVVNHEAVELPITCTVANIPDEIRVDLTSMEGTVLTAGEIALPAGVQLHEDAGIAIVSVSIVAEEAEGEEADAAGDGSSPDVIADKDQS